MMVCLESKDYVQIRNSLIILIKIVNHFPVLAKLATLIEKKVEKVREDEKDKRQDLYTLATSYCGLLKGRASQFLKDSDFHQVTEKVLLFLQFMYMYIVYKNYILFNKFKLVIILDR